MTHLGSPAGRLSKSMLLIAVILLGNSLSLPSPVGAQQQPLRTTAPRRGPATTKPLVFRGVTVVDVKNGRLRPEQSVVVVGNRIRAVGPTSQVDVPRNADVVDARNKYLIPGLWDMHTHTEPCQCGSSQAQDSMRWATYKLFIVYGVTGIREMAQRFPHGADSFRVWQREIMAGRRIGPRVIGPSADLSYYRATGGRLDTPQDAARVIDSLKAAGDAFVKYHEWPDDPNMYFALLREARRVGLPFVGHLLRSVPAAEAFDSGQRSVDHMQFRGCLGQEPSGRSFFDEKKCRATIAPLLRNGTWAVPTIAIFYYSKNFSDRFDNSYYMGAPAPPPDSLRTLWATADTAPSALYPMWQSVGVAQRAGVPILAGTDVSSSVTPAPGFMLQQELVLLVEAGGLTPLEALRAATLNPAKFINATDSLGTVAPGRLADLVLLDADPLADIHNAAAIRAVVANGRYFDRTTLDTLRAQAERVWPR